MDGRVYDPVIGRFLSADPIVPDLTNLQALNRYSYVYNSPLNYIDPDGHAPIPWLAHSAVGAAIGGGVSAYVAQQNGASPMQMFAAGMGGAIVGGLAGYGAYSVATKGVSLGIVGKGAKSGLRAMEGAVAPSGQFLASASGKFLTSTAANHLIGLQYTSAQDGESWDLNGDGIFQKNEADNWWLNGKGVAVTVDNSKINWKGLKIPQGLTSGDRFAISTTDAFRKLPYETAATYGGTSFEVVGPSQVMVLDQLYHYNYRPNNSMENRARNFMTWFGKPSKEGVNFMIHYKNPNIWIK